MKITIPNWLAPLVVKKKPELRETKDKIFFTTSSRSKYVLHKKTNKLETIESHENSFIKYMPWVIFAIVAMVTFTAISSFINANTQIVDGMQKQVDMVKQTVNHELNASDTHTITNTSNTVVQPISPLIDLLTSNPFYFMIGLFVIYWIFFK